MIPPTAAECSKRSFSVGLRSNSEASCTRGHVGARPLPGDSVGRVTPSGISNTSPGDSVGHQ